MNIYCLRQQFILKDATKFWSLFSIRMPQTLMLKPRPMNLYIKCSSGFTKIDIVSKIYEAKVFVKTC